MIALSLLLCLLLMLKTKDQLSIAVIADMLFYAMIGCYIVWSFFGRTQIAYEVIFLAAIVGGTLPTISVARIISKGRR
ncbi:cation:proton antiporter [Corynebacterium sp. SY003]